MSEGIDLLTGHTLLCGYGRVGAQLAKELRDCGEKFVIVDSDVRHVAGRRRTGIPGRRG